MPAQRPQAAFEPIPPNIDVHALVESTPNFEFVVRIHRDAIYEQGLDNFERLVRLHVVTGGKPLVVEGYDSCLEKWIFSERWLRDNYGTKSENARNLSTKSNLPLTIGHYLSNMQMLTDQYDMSNFSDPSRQRIYLKDIDCPTVWHEKLKELIPPFLSYLNESTGDGGGVNEIPESNFHGHGVGLGSGIARAGDLMSSLPSEMRAENLMCYIGHEGTYTPCHQEMCGTLGHNIMVEASTGAFENGKRTKPGSSIWFMTETQDHRLVSEYWSSVLGHDIDLEDHFAQISAWKAAPFKTYVVEQKVGDFILIPPLAPHQVWNRGTRTMKVAWNRTTVETLEIALTEALPRARNVCRDEQYKNKSIIYFTLEKYSRLLSIAEESNLRGPKVRQLQKDFRKLFNLFTQIMLSESFSIALPEEKSVEYLPFDSNVTCSYCRCNIFNRFLTCPHCVGKFVNGEDDCYDVCMECYAMGRSCACISNLKWVEQFRWSELTEKHEQWRRQIEDIFRQEPSEPLAIEQQRLGHRTLAEICQRELRRRPWVDITKPQLNHRGGNEDENEEEQSQKRRKIQRPEKASMNQGRCHICKTLEPSWKLASCTSCELNYCYGSLFRAFETTPQSVMEVFRWNCPKCRRICSCGACRRKTTMNPYEPKGLLLGHDTRKVADIRSVEALVNFSHSNIGWLKKAGDGGSDSNRRLQRHQAEAEMAKMRDALTGEEDEVLYNYNIQNPDQQVATYDGIPIDPALDALARQSLQVHQGEITPNYLSEVAAKVQQLHSYAENGIQRTQEQAYQDAAAIRFEIPFESSLSADNMGNAGGLSTALDPSLLLPAVNQSNVTGGMISVNGRPNLIPAHNKQPNRKSLIVRFNVGRERMQNIIHSRQGATGGVGQARLMANGSAIIESDLSFHNYQVSNRDHPRTKRRRGEQDKDFKIGRSQKTRTSRTALTGKPKRAARVRYFEDSDLSDSM